MKYFNIKNLINAEILFYILFGVYAFLFIADSTVIEFKNYKFYWYCQHLLKLLFPCCFLVNAFIYKVYSFKNLLISFGITLFCLGIAMYNGNTLIFTVWLLILCSRITDFRKFAKFIIFLMTVLVVPVMLMSAEGFIDDKLFFRDGGDIIVRHSLGFINPNTMSTFLFQLLASIIYVRWKNFGWKENLLIAVFFGVTYFVCNCRTVSLIILMLFVFVNLCQLNFKDIKLRLMEFFSYGSLILCPVLSFVLGYMYLNSSAFVACLNFELNHRIRNLAFCLHYYDISLFGNAMVKLSDFHILDNAYGFLLIQYGIIVFLSYIILYFFLIKRSLQAKMLPLVILLTVYLYYGLSEQVIFFPVCNFTILALSGFLHNGRIFKNEEDV